MLEEKSKRRAMVMTLTAIAGVLVIGDSIRSCTLLRDLGRGSITRRQETSFSPLRDHALDRNVETDKSSRKQQHYPARFLETLIRERGKGCARKKRSYQPQNVTYLAVARAGSGTLSTVFDHHNHDCTLRDLEAQGARHVVVSLRHPLARISSGVSRRLEGNLINKPANKLFCDSFRAGGTRAFITALQDENSPLHAAAYNATIGPRRQAYMLPVTEFYLADSLGQAEVTFLCLHSLEDDYYSAHKKWGIPPKKALPTKEVHLSETSSRNLASVFSRFSEENIAWVLETYAADVALFTKHCGSHGLAEIS